MKRLRCLGCGIRITKSALHDAYLCRECEESENRFAYLDG
jgi:hypothetical protein